MDVDWLRIKMPGLEESFEKRISHASSTTNLLISTIRRLASELRPVMLDELGLNASLEWQCKKFEEINALACGFESFFDDSDLETQVKTALYRVCQESLTNVKRHAHATKAMVTIYEKDNNIFLLIRDDGRGFEVAQKINTLGLIGMRERCVSVNGSLTVESEQGKGTAVCAIIPKQNN
jgi:two-component system sensor histidine kinase UhpB